MHVQALLSALRSSIVNQLEEAELNMAMRQSMENYKPHMSPACKMSIGQLVDCTVLEGAGSDLKKSVNGASTTVDQLSDSSCPICAEDFAVGDIVASKLPMCQHSFHSHCVKKWFDVNNTCPICRSVLPAKCQACMDNQKHTKDMTEQAEVARQRARSEEEAASAREANGEGGGGEVGAVVGSGEIMEEMENQLLQSVNDID